MKLLYLSSLLLPLSQAQYVIDAVSFGHKDKISPNKFAIPGWHVSGEGYSPQLLSDKVILTPPYPGNKRGALWTDARISQTEWVADFEFRATGPEHGGGNLQIWYTDEGQAGIGSSSIYTVEKFEGLVLVIDMYGGRGGGIRAFLNDGTMDFKNHHHVESLSFGHCDYSYRNLGRPSKVQMKQDNSGFEVSVDGNSCFRSDKVLLPSNNYFGITAASSDTPDSFEIYKFALSTTPSVSREEPRRAWYREQQQPQDSNTDNQATPPSPVAQPFDPQQQQQQQQPLLSASQLADLQSRLTSTTQSLDTLSTTLLSRLDILSSLISSSATADQVRALEARLSQLEAQLGGLQKEIGDHGGRVNDIHVKLGEKHDALLEGLQERVVDAIRRRGPRAGVLVLMVVVVQIGLVGMWYVWRKRKEGGTKKYI